MIELSPSEIQIALLVGGIRQTESMRRNRKDAHGYKSASASVLDIHVEGAAAEMAYCKARGVYWGAGVNTFKAADVGNKVQVRSTKLRNGCLIVREDDHDDHYYVLVVGQIPSFEVVGWILGRDAKRSEWKRSPEGREEAFFVPQNQLKKFTPASAK